MIETSGRKMRVEQLQAEDQVGLSFVDGDTLNQSRALPMSCHMAIRFFPADDGTLVLIARQRRVSNA